MAKIRATLVLLTLALLALAAAGPANARPAAAPATPFALDEGVEFEEEGEEEEATAEEECQEAEGEFATGEIDSEELAEGCERLNDRSGRGGNAREECLLRSAHGHAAVDERARTLKLTIGYTTYEPTAATIDVGKGTSVHRHLDRSGVIRIVESLPDGNAPKQLTVRFRIASAEKAGCPLRRLVLFPK